MTKVLCARFQRCDTAIYNPGSLESRRGNMIYTKHVCIAHIIGRTFWLELKNSEMTTGKYVTITQAQQTHSCRQQWNVKSHLVLMLGARESLLGTVRTAEATPHKGESCYIVPTDHCLTFQYFKRRYKIRCFKMSNFLFFKCWQINVFNTALRAKTYVQPILLVGLRFATLVWYDEFHAERSGFHPVVTDWRD